MRSSKESTSSTAVGWPRIDVEIRGDGSGEVRIGGAVFASIEGDDVEDARSQAQQHMVNTARQLGRPVQATTNDPAGSFVIVVGPDGTVREATPAARGSKRPKRGRKASATPPAPLEREGADAPGRGVPPTGHVRDPRPPFIPPAAPDMVAEQAEAERLAAEQAERDRLAAEQAEAERLAAEQAERDRLAAEQAEAERLAAEQAERDRLAAEQAEAERLAAEQAERDRLAAEQAEAERLAAEQAERDRLAAEQAEAERLAAEQAERDRLAAEQAEAERLAAEQAERERLAAGRLAAEQSEQTEQVRAQELDAVGASSVAEVDAPQKRRVPRFPRRRALVSGGVAVALLVTGGGAWHLVETQEARAAHAEWDGERTGLLSTIATAQEVWESSEDRVADPAIREALRRAIADAIDIANGLPSAESAAGADELHRATKAAIAAGALVESAAAAVRDAEAAWELEQASAAWESARAALSAAIDAASALLAASAGQVADDAARQSLATAVTAAVETRDADVDVDVADALEDAAAAAAESTTALEGPVEAVRQAQAAWLAEQERVAAAEAAQAAAAAAAAGSRGSANPSNAPAQPASGSAAQPQTSGGAGAGAATPAAAQVTKIQPGRVEYGADYVNISAVVTTNGPVAVTVTATISGRTVALSGPASVDGTATFSGSISGLAPGSYTWSVAANGLSTSARTIEVA